MSGLAGASIQVTPRVVPRHPPAQPRRASCGALGARPPRHLAAPAPDPVHPRCGSWGSRLLAEAARPATCPGPRPSQGLLNWLFPLPGMYLLETFQHPPPPRALAQCPLLRNLGSPTLGPPCAGMGSALASMRGRTAAALRGAHTASKWHLPRPAVGSFSSCAHPVPWEIMSELSCGRPPQPPAASHWARPAIPRARPRGTCSDLWPSGRPSPGQAGEARPTAPQNQGSGVGRQLK